MKKFINQKVKIESEIEHYFHFGHMYNQVEWTDLPRPYRPTTQYIQQIYQLGLEIFQYHQNAKLSVSSKWFPISGAKEYYPVVCLQAAKGNVAENIIAMISRY